MSGMQGLCTDGRQTESSVQREPAGMGDGSNEVENFHHCLCSIPTGGFKCISKAKAGCSYVGVLLGMEKALI